MTIARSAEGTIALSGVCGPEDAESLLQMLLETPSASLDWTACRGLHTAVFQVILAARPRVVGPCGDAWVEKWLAEPVASRR